MCSRALSAMSTAMSQEDVNFHLYHIAGLRWSKDPKDLIDCIGHYKAVVDLTGDASQAMLALNLAHDASLDLPEWAINFFKDEIRNQISAPFFPKVVIPMKKNIDKVRTLRKRRNVLSYAVLLLDKGILKSSEFDPARTLLDTLNRYCINGGTEGTIENPFKV